MAAYLSKQSSLKVTVVSEEVPSLLPSLKLSLASAPSFPTSVCASQEAPLAKRLGPRIGKVRSGHGCLLSA